MEITGIKPYIKYMLFISVGAYLLGRLFYVPPKYCYIDKVGFRPVDTCKQRQKLINKIPEINTATERSIHMIELWYYQVWLENKAKETRYETYIEERNGV